MWRGVQDLGFDGGRVLEPGCGSGLFLAEAPSELATTFTGIELDPVSADIARYLHPAATIRTESFADTPFADGTFDLTIGNVPFADVSLYDPQHNAGKHSLHNHFILKSLALTRPGGMVAVLTSRHTLDSSSDKARRAMWSQADLVGAVRLPSGAHRSFAGTDAVTDLVILRRRRDGETPGDDAWTRSRVDDDLGLPINDYWRTNPSHVLGSMTLGHGQYGRPDLTVRLEDAATMQAVPDLLADRLQNITAAARTAGLSVAGPHQAAPAQADQPVARLGSPGSFRGHLSLADDGTWHQLTAYGTSEVLTVPKSADAELRALLGLRDSVLTVLDLEAASRDDTATLADAREALRAGYDAYVARYGPINRVRVTETTRLDSDGQPIFTRRYPSAVRIFRVDPHSPVVKALEHYDEATNRATPAAILHERVLAPSTSPNRAETPADALAITLDTVGRVDLTEVARLLDTTTEDARTQLGTLVFDDPSTDRLVPAPEYLSGNVRKALVAAREAAADDARYQVNVDALTRVQPRDLGPDEIKANLGAVWVSAADYQRFLRETLSDAQVRVEHLGGANWKVRGGLIHSPAARVTWGTDRMPAHAIVERMMRQERVVVMDHLPSAEGGDVAIVNVVATEAAAAKAEQLQAEFARWIWSNPERVSRLTREYNDTFNALVLRSYDAEGDRLSLPGLAVSFEPHRHQRAAVARMVGEPSVGLFHAVGAGKTAEMVMGATELRRLGLVDKPCVVVPNHMLEQVTREWLQLYPAANILAAASEDLRGDGRRDFIARAATGSWDAVVLTQGAFLSIPVSLDAERAYRDREIQTTRQHLETARTNGVSSASLKQLEKAIIRAEERLNRLMDSRRDPGLTWEQTGIDYLVVDELHLYKNRTVISNIQDVAKEGSKRATDLDMKIGILRAQAGPHGRVLTGATATPIANSMAEAWVMQKYLRPDLLEAAGLTDFDAWAATFGRTVSKLEMRPAGDGFRVKDRFAAFDNLPELLQMWHVPADVKTAADLGLPIPDLAAGPDGRRAPEIVAVPLSSAQEAFMEDLGRRSKDVQDRVVPPSVDNMLKISSHGRGAGLDLRLLPDDVRPDPQDHLLLDEPTKVDYAASRIASIWREHREDTYSTGERPGALQIVFCDLGTPSSDREWNVYDALRDELAERGMEPSRIRFVHEAKNDEQKGRLFAACRSGEVDVIIGSTSKMGVGTNIQLRAVALHHLDCPWRPADVEQREGRILRQGNQNPEVRILRYVTEGSFDAYMWQGVARKAAFIDQVMHGRLDQRSAEDLDGDTEQFDYATITAIASGNPLLLDRADAQATVDKLTRLEAGHRRAQSTMLSTVRDLDHRIRALDEEAIPQLRAAVTTARPTRADAFAATVDGTLFTERPATADAIRRVVTRATQTLGYDREARIPDLVALGGHTFDASIQHTLGREKLTIAMRGAADLARVSGRAEILEGNGIVTRLENLVTGLPARLAAAEQSLVTARQDRQEAQQGIGAPFPQAEQLQQARTRLEDIERRLAGTSAPRGDSAASAAAGEALMLDAEAQAASRLAGLGHGHEAGLPATDGRHAQHARPLNTIPGRRSDPLRTTRS